MTEYNWNKLREEAARTFNDYPPVALEQQLIDVFEVTPGAVAAAVQKVMQRVRASKLGGHAGWEIVRRECANITRPAANVVVDDGLERERALTCAESWMKHAGLHFPTEGEVLRELFERGPLQKFDDDICRQRILAHYRHVRPVGKQLDCDMEKRARDYVESLPKLRKIQSRLKTDGSHGWKTLRDDVQRVVNSRQLTDTGLQLSDSASRDESMAA